ncbi:MAG: LysR family transcriptional regulator [Clostridiales bacterium]|nr:LysR family transcriptional regulator [Clostridiales bacterium]
MDMTSLYYFAELAKDLHMTNTANRLFISQQTLSNHIQRLEEYFGTRLLYRKPSLALTSAGEYVLAFAKIVNNEQTNLRDILSDIELQERGIIRFGASTLRMNACMPVVLPVFSERYPNVEMRLTNNVTDRLEPMVEDGELDMAIIAGNRSNERIVTEPLLNDQIYLVVSDRLLHQFYGEEAGEIKQKAREGALLRWFEKIPFSILNNRMGRRIQQCFDEQKVHPRIYLSTDYTRVSTVTGLKGLAACFTTQMDLIAHRDEIQEDTNIFPLLYKGNRMYQDLFLVRSRDRYLAHYSRDFVDLLHGYFDEVEHTEVSRTAGE